MNRQLMENVWLLLIVGQFSPDVDALMRFDSCIVSQISYANSYN